ncbi:dnaJ homolog subfamily C member 24 [Micropterus dolomieu]|uniref:dnaJ homolog subfamily C member 24 n=1 Tax=Micropterus dolomieu TaxID=147949 RepID=UPI001E8DFB91|nr:dnaJ homolog subfamily C member 24 [Micropterus dolomieu]
MHLKVVCNPSSLTKKKKEKQKNKKNKTHNIVEHYVVSHVTEFYGMCEAAEKDLYAVLGASPSDSLQQLRHRYQQLALQYHPDRLGGECSSEAESGVKKFLEVDAAWRILSDQNTRRQYDLQRRVRELKQDWPVDSTVYLEDMTWDQDDCVYTYSCRCGGRFNISEEEVKEGTQRKRQEDEEETEEEELRGVFICCDTCSLSVYVTWSLHRKTQMLKCQ